MHSPITSSKKRTRQGKTPAEKIIWTPEEVSLLLSLSLGLRTQTTCRHLW
jgi:hypothetical protein